MSERMYRAQILLEPGQRRRLEELARREERAAFFLEKWNEHFNPR